MAKPKVTVEPFVAPSEPQAQPEETVTIDMGNGITRTLARGKGSNRVSDAVWAEAQRQARKELADKQKENSVDGLVERTDKVKKSADQAVNDAQLPDAGGVDGLIERTQKVSQDAQQTAADAKLPETTKSGKKQRFEVTPGDLSIESADRRVGSGGLDPRAMGGSVADLVMSQTDPKLASRRKMIEQNIVPNFDGTLGGKQIVTPEELDTIKQMSPSAQAEFIDRRSSLKGYQEAHPAPLTQVAGDSATPYALPKSPLNFNDTAANARVGEAYMGGEQQPQPSLLDQAAHVIGQAPEALGAVFGGGKQPTQPQLADPVDTGDTKMGAPSQKAIPPDISMGGSVSVSSKTPGNAKVPVAPQDNYAAQLDANAKLQQDILNKQTEMSRLELESKADLIRQGEAEKSRLALENQQRMNAEMGEMKKHEDGLRDLQQQVLQASRESIDPDRFYNSRDTGQKIAGVLAGALFGFTGQGMQWLQRVDSLVAQDMQAQASDLARKRGYLQDASGLQNNLIAQAEKRGLKGDAAYQAAVITAKENIADQIMLNAMQYADPQLRLAAEKQAADIRMSTEKEKLDYANTAKTRALDAGLKVAQINHLNAQSYAARIAADKKEGSGGKPLPEAGVARLNDYAQNALNIINMSELAKNANWQERGQLAARNKFPLGYSEEKAKVSAFEAARNDWMTNKARGALQPAEVARLEPLLGSPTDIGSDPSPKLRLAGQIALQQLDTVIKQHRANGWDTTDYERQYDELKSRLAGSQLKFEPK